MSDPLKTLLNEHVWATIKNSPGATHHLIPLGGQKGGELLDWIEQTGDYDVWVAKPEAAPAGDPYKDAARTSGSFQTIRSGHAMVHLAHSPGQWSIGNVLDLNLATKAVRIYRYHRGITSGDPIPTKINQASFSTIGSGHSLIYLDHDRVLDWQPATGRARVWFYDRSRANTDPLPTLITGVTWVTIRTGYQLLHLGGELTLFWDENDGGVYIYRYDRSLTGEGIDPFPDLVMEDSWAGKIPAGRLLHYLGGDRVLEWDPATGQERIWDFDRPLMPAAAFQTMLTGDIARALTWVNAARTALLAYQADLSSSSHDVQWHLTDGALLTHFHAHNHPDGLELALVMVLDTFDAVANRLVNQTGSFAQVSKQQAVTDLTRPRYTRAYSATNTYTRLTPAYRPFDTIGNPSIDGAGDLLRAAIVIHETVHFVGDNPDSAEEWNSAYNSLDPVKAVKNPSSYAAFAHHVLTAEDLRFGKEPWR
ncbi:hypothetical protein AB0H94_35660 [Streptomyces purpurascens]|uniref:hypothetical protein n=1 Tax=Streptomyces purpurascens TaxID=1924 RepID=UPI0033D1AB56